MLIELNMGQYLIEHLDIKGLDQEDYTTAYKTFEKRIQIIDTFMLIVRTLSEFRVSCFRSL